MHLYLHIPFCRRACYYCDFHFSTSLKQKSAVTDALVQEIHLQKDYLQQKQLKTIYFGGGTPSLLNANELYDIFSAIQQNYSIDEKAEITLEANPDDITKDKIKIWQDVGINRLSIGIQSFDDMHLKSLNRIHTGEMAEKSVKLAQDMGIENITIDLIYAIPADTHSIWKHDLAKAIALQIPHISSYCLTIEEKTVFGKWLKTNKIPDIDDEFASKQFEMLLETLQSNGYEQYEISNFAKNKHYSVHNTSYWQGEEYLGIGPSAHSYNHESRQYNISNNALYIKALQEKKVPFEIEILSKEEKANDYILTGLRTQWGISLDKLSTIYGTLPDDFTSTIEEYLQSKHLQKNDLQITLSEKGKLFADRIASDLLFV